MINSMFLNGNKQKFDMDFYIKATEIISLVKGKIGLPKSSIGWGVYFEYYGKEFY